MKKGKSISELRPDLAAQWDSEKNYPLTPDRVSLMSKTPVSWICDRGHTWMNDPQHRARSKSAECPFCNGTRVIPYETDLLTLCPNLKNEWNYSRNQGIDPRTLHRSSNKAVWWICDKGHEWKTKICRRTDAENPTGCPYCANQRVIVGVNDLQSQRPEIASQWDREANYPLLPTQVMVGSSKRVQWRCQKGHTWKTTVAHRTDPQKPTGCPYCNNRRAIPGKTDLATLRVDLMNEWSYERNIDLDPTRLRPHSNKMAYWRCKRGHEWQARINSRTRPKGTKCPFCSGRLPIPGETDLQTKFPMIASQWDQKKNVDRTPSTISAASNDKVAWICGKGHRWEATAASRTCQGNDCPICYRESKKRKEI